MRKLAFTGIVLQPSVTSFTLVLITVLIVTVSAVFNFGGSSDHAYQLLLGGDSSPELVGSTRFYFENIINAIFDNEILNRVLFFTFWLLIGLVVYALLTGVGLSIGAIQKLHDTQKLLNARRLALADDSLLRLMLRCSALMAWILYMTVFLKLFVPFSVLSFQIAFSGEFSLSHVGTGLLGLAVLGVSVHLHVVLLRCFLLRPRVIGGWEDAVAAHLT